MNTRSSLVRICLASLALVCSAQALTAARFDASSQPLGSLAPLVLSNTNLSSGNVKAYRPWFENGSWQGDIVEYSVTANGTISTSIDLTGTTPVNGAWTPTNWSALVRIAQADPDTYWDTGRKIITWNGSAQKPFRWTTESLGAANMELLDEAAFDDGAASSKVLDFLRGDRSNEYPASGAIRMRSAILGDIIHSNPVYVAAPDSNRTDDGYAAWAAGKLTRAPRLYVGANDGMLHVFDATDISAGTGGKEVYAYVPSMLIGNLSKLAGRPYSHTYFVDGKLTVRDAYFGGSWHTVLVGALGAGGRGLFALDITDPNLTSETANTGSDRKVLWEVDATGDDDLGDSFSRAVIAKLNDGEWYAVVGNGYNSVNGIAILYLVDIETGAVRKITTGSGSDNSPNGLSSPSLLDTDRDGMADYAYAGDIDGNLWKFDLSSNDPDNWEEDYGRPLHPGTGNQPITMAPEIALHPDKGYVLYFGTGRLYTAGDVTDTSTQALYGVWDSGATPPLAADQSLLAPNLDIPRTFTSDAINEEVAVYNADVGYVDWTSQHGWKIDLPAGFRVLEAVQVRGGRAKVTATNPATRENWIIEASTLDGGPNPTPIYDLNADSVLNLSDLIDGNANSQLTDPEDVPMGWKKPDGVMSQVTIGRVADGIDTLYLNYLVPAVKLPCTGNCVEGFQGGHVDVDTFHDDEDYGGGSTNHTHEYDKKVGRVYVDYFDLIATGHVEIDTTDSAISPNEPFVVLVSNADFSPGSVMQIGNKQWNVATYQREIHMALKNWDATDPDNVPLDSDGASMIYTWGEIQAAGGTISHSFDDLAIAAGGLHPTVTGCVKGSGYETLDPTTLVGRWRNGALTTQLVKASRFSSNPAILDVDIQYPVDLAEVVQQTGGGQIELTEDFDGNGVIEAANHEEMGGLVAKSGTEHMWESTLFWHYSGNCYGDPDWRADVALELAENNAFDAALESLDIEDLDNEIAENEHCKDTKGEDGGCKEYYELLIELQELIADYVPPAPDAGDGPDSSGEVPVIMGGGAENEGVTSGPSFPFGRASWTDVVPN